MKRIVTVLLATSVLIVAMAMFATAATVVTVTDATGLNIRSGPGTSYDKVGSLAKNAQVTVLVTQTVDGYIWGQIENGWIRLDFTDYQEPAEPTVPGPSSNWKKENGYWYYYKDGQKATGWLYDTNAWYYMDGNGVMQTGWEFVNGAWYYLSSNGVMQTGWVSDAGVWYYMNGDGAMQTGWKLINGTWYYLERSGAMKTGWVKVNNIWYYMNGDGAMQTGWLKLGAAYYYLNESGAMQTGWLQSGENKFYLESSGVMAVGKVYIGEQAHKFSLDGVWQGETQNAFSKDAMTILKLEEGFSAKPYWDYTQWTVGYGTACPSDMLNYYKTNGISTEEAEILLREHMSNTEAEVDRYIAKYGLTLSKGQYDAIVLFSYNCGAGWCSNASGTFHNAIKNQVTGNALIDAFTQWCYAGGEVKDYLVRRRLSEANMYLNGEYSQTPPENFCFVTYDANGGTIGTKTQGYDTLLSAAPYLVPTFAGYTFDGWYTEKSGGTKVEVLGATHNNTTLYAHWSSANQNTQTPGSVQSVVVTVTSDTVNLRKDPYVDDVNDNKLTAKPQVNKGTKFTLMEYAVEQHSDGTRRWGKFTEYGGGWVCLDYTDYDTVKNQLTSVNLVDKDDKTYCMLGIEIQTGWQKIGGQWYYADASGVMMIGWVYDGSAWYYLNENGTMVVGWRFVNQNWYYFGANGAMKVGWQKDGNKWYYLKSDGAMATGWIEDGGKKYYMNANGAMVTGWLQLGEVWYYLAGDGTMVTGQMTIGPVTYTFNENGVWLG